MKKTIPDQELSLQKQSDEQKLFKQESEVL
jgi:hypothetical protein